MIDEARLGLLSKILIIYKAARSHYLDTYGFVKRLLRVAISFHLLRFTDVSDTNGAYSA